jgi:hypothetical protein
MPDRRVRILCNSMGAAFTELARIGLPGLDPRWCYAMAPADLRYVEDGAHVVDLTHKPHRTMAGERLRDHAVERRMRLVSVHHLARLPPYVHGTG